jgi:hypothetical protein
MWDEVGKLHAYHGDVPVEGRLLKLTEGKHSGRAL